MDGLDMLMAGSEIVLEVGWAALVLGVIYAAGRLLWVCSVIVFRTFLPDDGQ